MSAVSTSPGLPLRVRVLAAGLGALVAAVAATSAAGRVHDQLVLDPRIAAGVIVAIVVIALGTVTTHHPFPRWGAANHVTLFRSMLLALAASAVTGTPTAATAWFVAIVAGVFALLDGVDGRLARRSHMTSTFGARFDMEVDALFILVLSVLTWRHDKAGVWILAAGLMRYVFVVAGWAMPWLARPLAGSWRGKAVAVSQVATLGAILAPIVPRTWSYPAAAAALLALTWSFAIDVRFLWRKRHRDRMGR